MSRDGSIKIPDILLPDGYEDYQVFFLCVPKNGEWSAIVRGAIYNLTRGRSWARDDRISSIKEAQLVAWEIYNSMGSCDASLIVESLNGIKSAIQALQSSVIVNNCCDTGSQPSPSNPVGDIDFSDPLETIPAHLPQDIEDAFCHWINYLYGNFVALINKIEFVANAGFGVAIVASLLAIVFPEPVTTVLGTFTFLALATGLLSATGALDQLGDMLEDFRMWIEDNFNDIYCMLPVGSYLQTGLAFFDALGNELADRMVAIGYPEQFANFARQFYVSESLVTALFNEWYANGQWQENFPENPLSCACYQFVDCIDLSNCGIEVYAPTSVVSVTNGQPSNIQFTYNLREDGVLEFDFVVTGSTVESTPDVQVLLEYANAPSGTLAGFYLHVFDLVVTGVGTGANVNGIAASLGDGYSAGNTQSSVRSCIANEILSQFGYVVTLGVGGTRTIEVECNRPGADNQTRITGRAKLCTSYI